MTLAVIQSAMIPESNSLNNLRHFFHAGMKKVSEVVFSRWGAGLAFLSVGVGACFGVTEALWIAALGLSILCHFPPTDTAETLYAAFVKVSNPEHSMRAILERWKKLSNSEMGLAETHIKEIANKGDSPNNLLALKLMLEILPISAACVGQILENAARNNHLGILTEVLLSPKVSLLSGVNLKDAVLYSTNNEPTRKILELVPDAYGKIFEAAVNAAIASRQTGTKK